jgi:hypothetical protein
MSGKLHTSASYSLIAVPGVRKKGSRWWYAVTFLAIATILIFGARAVTSGLWLRSIGKCLVCEGNIHACQAILIENFDPNYLLFEHVAKLLREKQADKVFIPVQPDRTVEGPNSVSEGIVQVMSRAAWIPQPEMIPIKEIEPISLSAALQVRDYLHRKSISSVIIVTSGFRSRRSIVIWNAVLRPSGIAVFCCPVFSGRTSENWYLTWHGRQEVIMEAAKLLYYRLYVLPRFRRHPRSMISSVDSAYAKETALAW